MATSTAKLALLIHALALVLVVAVADDICHFKFEVRTGDRFAAGTDGVIFYELDGRNGTGWLLDIQPASGSKYERGNLDTFTVDGRCMEPGSLTLRLRRRDSFEWTPDWFCVSVSVTVSGGASYKRVFPVGRWIAADYQPVTFDKSRPAKAP